MNPKIFLSQVDDQRVIDAIAEAERQSSGQIRVYISERQIEEVLSEAKVHFLRLGMEKTRARNAVLIYIAPHSRNFAVVGDLVIHEKCGDDFWQRIASAMAAHLKQERYTDALIDAIQTVGDILAQHFPRQADDKNELPDAIEGD